MSSKVSGSISKIFDSTMQSIVLTDYLELISKGDSGVIKFDKVGVYPPKNSISMYKMISIYLTIFPKEQMPIDMEKLNEAVLNERGYLSLLVKGEEPAKSVLRFNSSSFKDNYKLADLAKMKLTFYCVRVGTCTKKELSLEGEVAYSESKELDDEYVTEGTKNENVEELEVYDVVLAGVEK